LLTSSKTTDYVGNKVYENGSLKRILTENGYYENGNYYFYIKNHLGSNVITADRNGNIVQSNHYYPFGLTMAISTGQGVQPYKYTGKELDMEHGLMQYDYEARQYDPTIGRFTTMDPLAEKYYSISPYAYCGNNPVSAYDLHGDSIWYTKDDNVITMHVTGKVINQSSDNINVSRAANDIASGINNAFSGEFEYDGQTYTLQTSIQLESVTTMDDVTTSDHLFVLADADGKSARGVTSMDGGKVMTVAASDYANDNWFSNIFSSNDTRTAVHEFGHAAGLRHESASGWRNLMTQGGGGSNVTSNQRAIMLNRSNSINRGPNSYSRQPYPYAHYYERGQWRTIPTHRVLNMGRR
jgi:RHS repeat-associated protein